MLTRFQSGYFSEDESVEDKGNSLEKNCLIVYPGTFQSMDGEVEVTPEHIALLAKNHNSVFERAKRLATGDVPLKDCPPLQLDHQTTATHTVGRLVGPLSTKEVEIDGEKKLGLFGRVRVLGADNVEKVKDGRWIHLSMGADLEDGKLTELTITPFPAAAQASMLSNALANKDIRDSKVVPYRGFQIKAQWGQNGSTATYQIFEGNKSIFMDEVSNAINLDAAIAAAKKIIDEKKMSSKGESMFSRLKKRLSGEETGKEERMTYDEMKSAMELYAKCRKHLMEKQKLSEEDADKHLSEMDDESMQKMAMEQDEEEKKMASKEAEKDGERMARLQKASDIRSKLSSAQQTVQLAQRKAKLAIKLSSLKALAKITPAELKKLDIAKLATSSEEAISLALATYDNREPVIDPRIYGSSKGVEAAELVKLAKEKELEKETRKNFKSAGGNKTRLGMAEDAATEKIQKEVQEVPEKMSSETHEHLKSCLAHLEAGRHDEAKEALKACLAKLEAPSSDETMAMDEEETQKHLSALAEASLTLESTLKETDKLMTELVGEQ